MVSSSDKRILPIDLVRGFLLFVIIVDHVEFFPSLYDLVTGRGRMYVSAAEGFFLTSGFIVGYIYRKRLSNGLAYVCKKIWSRAAKFYLLSVGLTLMFTYWALKSHHPGIKYGLPPNPDWHHIISQTLTLQYSFGWADFLPRYAVFMAIAPLAVFLLYKRLWWAVLALSVSAWLLRDQNFFLSWQIVFFPGIVIGWHWDAIINYLRQLSHSVKRRLTITLLTTAFVTLALSYASVYFLTLLNQNQPKLPVWLMHFTLHWNAFNDKLWVYSQKWTLGPLRLAFFASWFAATMLLVNRLQKQINYYTKGFLALLGRNSLFVYVLHAIVIFAIKMVAPTTTGLMLGFAITSAALLSVLTITATYVQWKKRPVDTTIGTWVRDLFSRETS